MERRENKRATSSTTPSTCRRTG